MCPYCGAIGRAIADLRGHTRQECESRIRDRIALHEGAIAGDRERLAALHAAANADQQVPA